MKKIVGLIGPLSLFALTYLNAMSNAPLDDTDLGLCWLFGDDEQDQATDNDVIVHNSDNEDSAGSSSQYLSVDGDNESSNTQSSEASSSTSSNEAASSSSSASASSDDDDTTMQPAPQTVTHQEDIMKEGFCKHLFRRLFAPCIAGYVKVNDTIKHKLAGCKEFTCKWGCAIFCTKTGRALLISSALTSYYIAIETGMCNDHVNFGSSVDVLCSTLLEKAHDIYETIKKIPQDNKDL